MAGQDPPSTSANAMTPALPFSPAVSQALAGSSPHAGMKKSPHSSALMPSLSSSGLQFGSSPASSGAGGAKYLASLLGVTDGATPAGTTPGASGGATIMGPKDDKEKTKLRRVLKILKSRPGKICEEGIKRVAKRAGMQYHTDSSAVKGVHTLIVSGDIVVIDIDFKDDVVTRVTLSFAETPGPSAEFAGRAAKILEKTLTPTGGVGVTSSLVKFADNLERFARADRLSALPSLNCFSAMTGLYVSLMKVWEKEVSVMGELDAMCKGMGRPGMHLRGKVGVCIDYWKERRTIETKTGKDKGKGKGGDGADEEDGGRYWRVVIDVDEVPGEGFIHPARTSEDWVSDNVLKGTDLFGQENNADAHEVDWIEPPLNNYEAVMNIDVLTRLNSTRFVARLDPPVVVGIDDEVQILTLLSSSSMSPTMPAALQEFLCPKYKGSKAIPSSTRTVKLQKDGSSDHTYNMNSLRQAYGRVLEEIPFSHPRQLGAIFQILRKYTFFDSVFHSAFPEDLVPPPNTTSGSGGSSPTTSIAAPKFDLDTFLSDDAPIGTSVPVDLSLNSIPLGISLLFPCDAQGTTGQVEINVLNNADLEILAVVGNGLVGAEAAGVNDENVKKVVEVTEDIGILVEWVRGKMAKVTGGEAMVEEE